MVSDDCLFLRNTESTLLFQGAEAKIYLLKDSNNLSKNGQFLLKQRLCKRYRHSELDKKLTTKRITQECRSLLKCHKLGIKVPIVYLSDLSEKVILMEYLHDYTSLRNFLESCDKSESVLRELSKDVASLIVKLHDNTVIHGDLTTCNLLVKKNEVSPSAESVNGFFCKGTFSIVPIDFGLSSISESSEDKAVDLYVLERAINTTHAGMELFFETMLNHYYALSAFGDSTKTRLEEVRARGRKRDMLG